MNNAVAKHISEYVEKLNFDIEILGQQVVSAQSTLDLKKRKLAEATVLRNELALMLEDCPPKEPGIPMNDPLHPDYEKNFVRNKDR